MAAQLRPISERTVMSNVGITEQDLERRKKLVGLGPSDYQRIAAVRDLVERNADTLTTSFFEYLGGLEGARVLMSYKELTTEARALKRQHLLSMVSGKYDLDYVEQRIRLGLLYGRVGLETKVFLGAFQQLLANIGRTILRESKLPPEEAFESFAALQKVGFFDVGIQVDVLIHERERTINVQSEAIRELSTPVLKLRNRLLLMPLIGVIDTHRARLITENILKAIRTTRAKVVVMDVTGVATIDSKVANHLLQTVVAAKLMGALVIVSGVSADVAQSMVALGIELRPFTTVGDLQGGIEDAERMLGYRVTYDPKLAAHPEA
jgi:rsbT co-antagonist protein RsbR